ncbi:MAG: tRNA pseudouridine(55) synthase TruB [Candidatus Peregrinibacteria bacterium]
MNGLLVINKPSGWTSFDVVAKVRGMLRAKKVGHAGTLDPMATGVLVLCVGNATKSVDKIMKTEKEYIGEITLGATSNTDDADGVITHCRPDPESSGEGPPPSLTDIQTHLLSFTGTYDQLPPQFSAKKVEGRRAYALARAGKTVDLKPVSVTVHELELLDYTWPVVKIRVRCGKGFYMRSLARDLGQKLSVGGYLSSLVRTRVGQYSIDEAITIEQVEQSRVFPL